MRNRSGVITVLLVVLLATWFGVSIVTAWSAPAPVIAPAESHEGYCDRLKKTMLDAELREETQPYRIMNAINSARKPDDMTQEDANRLRDVWLDVELAKLSLETQKWKEAYSRDCDIQ